MSFTITSTAFAPGDPIPARHACEGEDLSPALAWRDPPERTRSFALIVDDPDAPDPAAPKRTWVHWVLYNIPASARALAEAATGDGLPEGTLTGVNDDGREGYSGPCPPTGRHRYFFKLYALDTVLRDLGRPTKAQLESAMTGHILRSTQLMGTYEQVTHAEL